MEVIDIILSQMGDEVSYFFIHVRIIFGGNFPGVISGSFFCPGNKYGEWHESCRSQDNLPPLIP